MVSDIDIAIAATSMRFPASVDRSRWKIPTEEMDLNTAGLSGKASVSRP